MSDDKLHPEVSVVQRRLAARRAAQRAAFAGRTTEELQAELVSLREQHACLTAPEHGIESAKIWGDIARLNVELRRRSRGES